MSRHGKDDGYFLIDAILSLLITTLVAGAVLASIGTLARRSGAAYDRAMHTIEGRNADAEKRIGSE